MVIPLLREVGDRWERGELTVAHEHIVTAQLRDLVAAVTRRGAPLDGVGRILVATPAGHRHEFGLLAGAFLAAGRGFECVYLGLDVPEVDLALAISATRAGVLLLSAVRDLHPDEVEARSATLTRLAETTEVWLGCPRGHALSALHATVRPSTATRISTPRSCTGQPERAEPALRHPRRWTTLGWRPADP